MIRIAICDDKYDFSEHIKTLINKWPDPPEPVSCEAFTDGDSLISAHGRDPFDIILLDILMPVLNGIDTAHEIREFDKNVKIVFLTSSPEFALDSYSVKASNYLVKPLAAKKLYECLCETIESLSTLQKCILVKKAHATHRIPVSAIEYVEAQNKYVRFKLTDGNEHLSSDTFTSFLDQLTEDDGFFKCHRSYLVNMFQISSFSTRELTTRSGTVIPIARSCQKDFEAKYFSIIFKKAGGDGK